MGQQLIMEKRRNTLSDSSLLLHQIGLGVRIVRVPGAINSPFKKTRKSLDRVLLGATPLFNSLLKSPFPCLRNLANILNHGEEAF